MIRILQRLQHGIHHEFCQILVGWKGLRMRMVLEQIVLDIPAGAENAARGGRMARIGFLNDGSQEFCGAQNKYSLPFPVYRTRGSRCAVLMLL